MQSDERTLPLDVDGSCSELVSDASEEVFRPGESAFCNQMKYLRLKTLSARMSLPKNHLYLSVVDI